VQFVIESERNRLRHGRSPILSGNDRAEIEFRSSPAPRFSWTPIWGILPPY
jgi:hypothetical protein